MPLEKVYSEFADTAAREPPRDAHLRRRGSGVGALRLIAEAGGVVDLQRRRWQSN